MARFTMRALLLACLVAPGAGAAAADAPPAKVATEKTVAARSLDRLRALAGEWAGVARPEGSRDALPAKALVRVVSGGSAVMLVTDPGSDHEMVTLFHEDDGALLATHYCAAQNQPRLKAVAGDAAGPLVFEFLDGTNLGAHPGRMQRLALTVPDAKRQVQVWTYRAPDGKTTSMTFELARADAR